jgi:hypothetical protein
MALASSLKLQCYPIPLVPPEGDEVDKVRKATQIVREKRPDLK